MKRARANSGRRRIGIERVAARPDAWAEWLVGTSSHAPSRAVSTLSPADQTRDWFPVGA
jgi:hypothetical protein